MEEPEKPFWCFISDMNAYQDEIYCKCASKLEKILSKQDYDLRIVVGHSNMLQSLTPAVILQHGDDEDDNQWKGLEASNPGCEAETDLISCPEYPEELFPLLYEISVTERELPPDEADKSHQTQPFVIEKSHIVIHSALPVRPKLSSSFVECLPHI